MDEIETATGEPAQDITSRIEEKLFGSADPKLEQSTDEEDIDDAEELPEDDDSDSGEDGSEDLNDDTGDEEEELSLAQHLGLDDDRIDYAEDGTLVFNAIIDGEAKKVPLKDLAASYQLQGHVNNKSMALEQERKEFAEERSSKVAQLDERMDGVDALAKALENDLVGDYNSIDWEKLRIDNPAEWTALRQEFADKASRIQQAQGLVNQERTRVATENEEVFNKANKDYLDTEYDKLLVDNPDWADETKRVAAQAEIKQFLSSEYGFSDKEFALVTDSRLMKLIQDAKSFRIGSKTVAEKKEKIVPKFRKSTNAKANANQLAKARSVKAKKARVKSSNGSTPDIANLILDRM